MKTSATPPLKINDPLRSTAGALILCVACSGCASPPPAEFAPTVRLDANPAAVRNTIVETARSALGVRYRYGGDVPEQGFDCSGLVAYSYRRAGVSGLPRTARELERRAKSISLDDLMPGDLLFFRLTGVTTNHVAIYEGDRRFIHAPSNGKGVERVHFDHVYWGTRIKRAGRLLP